MKTFIFIIAVLFSAVAAVSAQQINQPASAETIKIEAQPGEGFAYPYYLYIPAAMREPQAKGKTFSLLVVPNNTGAGDDDLSVHEQNVKQKMMQVGFVFGKLNVPVLMPVFPRPRADWKIYTHALDRDSLVTEKAEYKRFDRQLAAMIESAREKFAGDGLKVDSKVLMYGFSAAGMFVNRFAFLHPDKVKAVASGSPGGWALAPVEKFKAKTLRYPIGTGDFKTVSGDNLDAAALQKVRFFFFLGDRDENDSVVFGDGYDAQDKDLIFELFGKTPLERWAASRKIYAEKNLNAEFRLYPNAAHKVTPEMVRDVLAFLQKNLEN